MHLVLANREHDAERAAPGCPPSDKTISFPLPAPPTHFSLLGAVALPRFGRTARCGFCSSRGSRGAHSPDSVRRNCLHSPLALPLLLCASFLSLAPTPTAPVSCRKPLRLRDSAPPRSCSAPIPRGALAGLFPCAVVWRLVHAHAPIWPPVLPIWPQGICSSTSRQSPFSMPPFCA